MLCDPAIRATVEREGHDPDQLVDIYIDAINRCVAGSPDDMHVGVHVCRGNFKGNYLSEGGYDAVAEPLFMTSKVSHFLLEYDTPRAGDFKPLRFVPKNMGIVLGLVSSKTPVLESQDDLRRRIDDAAQHIDMSQLAISPQCGFASDRRRQSGERNRSSEKAAALRRDRAQGVGLSPKQLTHERSHA